MSDYKILIISRQVEDALQSAATPLIGQGRLSCVQDSDHIIYRYNHPEYGTQSLILNAINEDWSTVSFAGREEFLQSIRSEGWYSSAESLIAFFEELGMDVSFNLRELEVYEFGNYAAFINSEEGLSAVRLAILAHKLGVQVDERVEDTTVTEDTATTPEQPELPESDKATTPRKSWVRQVCGHLRMPTVGEVSLGASIAAVGVGAFFLTRTWLES